MDQLSENSSPTTSPTIRAIARRGAVALVGVSFNHDAVADVQVGDPVTVIHEEDNEHDANAIIVLDSLHRPLGFFPAALSARIANEGGIPLPLAGRIVSVRCHDGAVVGADVTFVDA